MFQLSPHTSFAKCIEERSEKLFNEQTLAVHQRTDRIFAWLLLLQWFAAAIFACVNSPRTWTGSHSDVHIHVWTAIFLGALIISRPIYLIWTKPGQAVTRHSVAVGQMLYSALLIHLSGGRIETHFHIFGSLAFLSFYRDWRVLITASLVVVGDHILRGIYFPQSIYGVNAIEPLRWIEHAWWVVFEDVFLIMCCRDNLKEMQAIALRQAEVEITRDNVEELVKLRTFELQASEQKLAAQLVENAQLANIVQWAGDAIIGQDLEGRITSWNNGAEKHFGYSSEEIKGRHSSILTTEQQRHELEEDLTLCKAGKTVTGRETQRIRKDGKCIEVSLTCSPVFDDQKNIIGICKVMHNISDRKEAERRVSEFYSIVSHELRTPLTSVRGALGLVENGVVEAGSPESNQLITVARESTDRLIRLINDILDLKKIESGKMELNLRPLPVDSLVSDCLRALTGMSGPVQITLEKDMRFKGQIFADHDKTTQILTNLVSNAVKFSPAGSKVTVRTEARENMMRFTVIDKGAGISTADQAKLFEKFQQLDSSDTRQKGGTGLGLAISRALVEEQKGKIGVDSEPGNGSSFWFELPLVMTEVTSPNVDSESLPLINQNSTFSETRPALKKSKNILLVEDDANLAKVLSVHFTKSDYATQWAGTISDARALLHSHTFDVVVLDLSLPDGSGLDLLDEIKSHPHTESIPVIVVTGQTVDNRSVARTTVADWLPKPFNTEELVEVIDRVTASSSVKAVMVSDCDTGVRRVVGTQLKALGLCCIEDLEQLKLVARDQGQFFPVVVYLSRELTDAERESLLLDDDLAGPQTRQMELLDAVSELIGGICK